MRKQAWRIRYLPADDDRASRARTLLHEAVTPLRQARQVSRCTETIYEPETEAFGGDQGMAAAHDLFHGDSRHIFTHLAYLDAGPVRRRELSVLLCTALMRTAGLDWFERGDVWAKVVALRPAKQDALAEQWEPFQAAVERLLVSDISLGGDLRSGPIAFAAGWVSGFEAAGRRLRALAEEGLLARGLRAVIAHHVIFHWNRVGLPALVQANLALAAQKVVFDSPGLTRTGE
ncbi:thiopeptide-type bacteriocin biosynthesis protein (plasmid) [Streptosporangium sp. CA-135522]|uniref:thiopeptide-type bacteriocin biosynthesis protein n=1 Tax=Streptosporangium sp. CA-135522 TaxID=3240072 RepID=UPI003D89D3F7